MSTIELETEAIIGLAAGFGSIVGGIILCCVVWNCCCSTKSKEKLVKKKPTGPWMEMCNTNSCQSTSSTTPISQASRNSNHKWDQPTGQHPLKAPYKQTNAAVNEMHHHKGPTWNQQASNHKNIRNGYSHENSPQIEERRGHEAIHHRGTSRDQDTFDLQYSDHSTPTDLYALEQQGESLDRVRKNPELFYQRYLY